MHDIKFIRENAAEFDRIMQRRGLEFPSVQILRLDEKRRKLQTELQALQALRNDTSKQIGVLKSSGGTADELIAEVASIKQKIPELESAELVVICNKLEAEIAELDDEERAEFLSDLGMEAPGLDRVIQAGYRLLGLQTYFTAGPKEARAWTIRSGVSAPQAAGVIHTDFERGFIKAEVIGYEDYVQYDGESGARGAGRLRLEGKEYTVQDGDVIHFRFNV